ncbi:hypothetical protein F503_04119 [Ophiostoma piceae UAMH 11346]|uniref:Uncharacterized protein n=1 Tax=Ophiostoma piceae (strain UAMH 11346) TaxID=1262450 RepID=S3C6U9_OPHP1|nr:hypothetical protein F503_04119 [Ophiostoma piceae UAMH 11346]
MPLWQSSLLPSTGDNSGFNDCSEIDIDSRPASPFAIDTRAPRPPRLNVNVPIPAVDAIVDMAAITATASNPVSPGPPSPSPDLEARPHDFVPPTRPSSTPFPQPDQRIDDLRCLGVLSDDEYMGDMDVPVDDDNDDEVDDRMDLEFLGAADDDSMDVDSISEQDDGHLDDSLLNILASAASLSGPLATSKMDLNTLTTPPLSRPSSPPPDTLKKPTGAQTIFLQNLPMEIQVLILDYVFECTVSPMMKSWPDKRLTKLACFTQIWRTLIQERLYCRLKLKATGQTVADAIVHFADHPHLRSYVKHVELWFPVFEPKLTRSILPPLDQPSSSAYSLPSDNCSLEEAFFFLSTTFLELSVLTLEGGERKKAPQAHLFSRQRLVSVWFDDPALPAPAIPQIRTVRTLVCKGQWNLIRCKADFQHIAAALPNLNDWRGSYSKPKSKSYLSMATILPNLPTNITSLDLCLEGDFRQEISFPPFFHKVTSQIHFCTSLAEATPALQHLSYTGRVCRIFFDLAATLADPRYTRLKSIELNVKNCCRHVTHWHESGSGATDINFIRAFEALVLSGVRSLEHLNKLEYLRIRYVDLEFPVPPLNPFFLLENGVASGVWSDTIVSELNRVRPNVRWAELSETIGERTLSNGRIVINAEFPKRRVISLKLSNYAFLVALVTTP